MSSLIAAVRERDANDVLGLILLLAGVLCICGAAYKAWLRDIPVAAALLIIGVVILFIGAA